MRHDDAPHEDRHDPWNKSAKNGMLRECYQNKFSNIKNVVEILFRNCNGNCEVIVLGEKHWLGVGN